MAGRRQEQSQQHRDEAVLHDLWDWCAEPSSLGGYGVTVSMRPTPLKGRWTVLVQAHHVVDGRAAGVVARVRGEYPNGEAVSLAYYLYRLMMRLDTLASSDALRAEQ